MSWPGRPADTGQLTVVVPVTEQELVGLRLRRPEGRPKLRVKRRPDGARLLVATEPDRWALELLTSWRAAL